VIPILSAEFGAWSSRLKAAKFINGLAEFDNGAVAQHFWIC